MDTQIIYKERGGGWIGKGLAIIQGTWPFGLIYVFDDKVFLKVGWKSVEVTMSDIIKVNRIFILPFLADGIKIKHKCKDVAPVLIFWSFGNAKRIQKIIQSKLAS